MSGNQSAGNVATYLQKLEVVRFHITTTYMTLQHYRDDFRVIYKCANPPPVLPLFWQDRQIQTNMIVLDSKNANLIYLPHEDCYALEREYIRTLWGHYVHECAGKSRTVPAEPPEVLLKVADFDVSEATAAAALDRLKREIEADPKSEALDNMYRYIWLMCRWYIPLVTTPERGSTDYLFVRSGLDYYQFVERQSRPHHLTRPGGPVGRPTSWDWFQFALIGSLRLKHPVPFDVIYYAPWSTTHSVHIRLRLPNGLEVRGHPRTDFDEALNASYFQRALRASPSEVYAYLGAFESRAILSAVKAEMERREKLRAYMPPSLFRYDGPPSSSEPKKVKRPGPTPVQPPAAKQPQTERLPELNILTRVGISWAMRAMLGLFWAVVVAAWVYRFSKSFALEGFFVLLTGLLIVVVATAIATIDKPTVRIPVSVHTVLAVAVFFASLVF